MSIGNPVLRCKQDIEKALETLERELAGLNETNRRGKEDIKALQRRLTVYCNNIGDILDDIDAIRNKLGKIETYARAYDKKYPKPKETESNCSNISATEKEYWGRNMEGTNK